MSAARPRPPEDLTSIATVIGGPKFTPAPDVIEWARQMFILPDAPLANPVHQHLEFAEIGVLWTNMPNSRQGRPIVGQAEFRPPNIIGVWPRARAEQQLHEWFRGSLDFLITLDAGYSAQCSDAEFCALVEHELGHCGQECDEFGMPKFRKSGLPAFCMRGHDIEQFTFVVARYGADAAGVRAMIEAAKAAPEIGEARVAIACGSCG